MRLDLGHFSGLFNHLIHRSDHLDSLGLTPFRYRKVLVPRDPGWKILQGANLVLLDPKSAISGREMREDFSEFRELGVANYLAPGVGFEPTRPARTTG
jgi:hypothetical protein